MLHKNDFRLGVMFRREHAPEHLPDFARKAEQVGYEELWVVEDCFYSSGIASAAAALSSTQTIKVGLGIIPAVVRNSVFAAMEIATLARIYPGRFIPGLGHGMAGWMRQIGALPKSQLKALEETAVNLRKLLAGEKVTFQGEYLQLDQAGLVFPPEHVPEIFLGVRGPKSLRLSGRIADGTILAEFASPAYIKWASEQINLGMEETGRLHDHHLTVFVFACANAPAAAARRQIRPLLASAAASDGIDAQLAPMGILPQVREYLAGGGADYLEANIQDEWIDQLAVVGTPEEWGKAVDRLVEAGANSVVLVPLPGKGLDELSAFAKHFL